MVQPRALLAVAGSLEFPDLDDSWPILRHALEEEGFEPSVVAWEDPCVEWSSFSTVLVNYTWGFVAHREEFLAWASSIADSVQLVNSLEAIIWGSSKRYLLDLAGEVPVVPTAIVEPGASWSAPAHEYVIKPAVSSGGIGAARYEQSELARAEAHVQRLHAAGREVIVQPYQLRVDTEGETGLVFLGGEFSHAIRKAALLEPGAGEVGRLWEREVISETVPGADELSVGIATIAAASRRIGELAYARVDLVEGDGGPQVLEVEVIEPSLFLPAGGLAARQLARQLRESSPR